MKVSNELLDYLANIFLVKGYQMKYGWTFEQFVADYTRKEGSPYAT